MPIFNAGKYLRPAVLSVIKQSFRDWELLLIDDGSTDDSLDSINDIQDKRIRIIRDGLNKGLAARLNEAIDLAHGKYFARMDQDDISYPERFARQVALLDEDKTLDLVGVRSIVISGDDEISGIFPYSSDHYSLCARPWRGFYFMHPTWMGRIKWFRRYRYASPGPFLCEDQELLLRSYEMSRFSIIPDILFAYRVRGPANMRKLLKTRWTVLNVQFRHFAGKWQPVYAMLATASFAVRVCMDVMNSVLHALGVSPFLRYRSSAVDSAMVKAWNDVLNDVQ
jgi:glycosyltransferase involved in cell wall biosynthesis